MSAAPFVGLLLLVAAAVLAFVQRRASARLRLLESTETSTVAHLRALAAEMSSGGLGSGNLHFLTEVRGRVVCASPLVAELSETPAVYYRMRVSRQYDETYWTTDDKGHRQRRTRSGSETVAENERAVPFLVDDGTGTIRVEPGGAETVAVQTMSRFDPSGDRRNVRIGTLQLDLPAPTGDRRTTGYRYEEHAVPVGREVYVLGDATDASGELCLRCPPEEKKFLISTQGEEELVHALRRKVRLTLVAAIVCGLLGLAVLVAAVV